MNTPQRVFIYARVSTPGQTVDPQLRDLGELCKYRGWEPREFIDVGIGGGKESRPGWNQCWDGIRKRQADVLLVPALDRLGRSLPHLVSIMTDLTERGIAQVSYRENIDLSTSSGRMLAGIFSVLAEYERSIISERTKAGLRAARARGKRIGRLARYFDTDRAQELRAQGWGQIRLRANLALAWDA